MTHAEKRMLVEAHSKVIRLEARLAVLTELLAYSLERKAGRPSQQTVDRIEELKGQLHAN